MIDQKLQQEINIVMTVAKNSGLEFVTVEHLLLALTNVDEIIDLFNDKNIDIIQMQTELEEYIEEHTPTLSENSGIEIVPTVGFERVLQRSVYEAQLAKKPTVYAIDVLTSIFSEEDSHAVYLLKINNLSKVGTLKSKKSVDNPLNYYDLFERDNPYVEFHENGNKRIEISYKGEHMHGPFKCWHESGQIEKQATYVDNKLDGKYISWHENGIKAVDEIYFQGELDGASTRWYDNGQKELEADYLLGVFNGAYTRWHRDGSLDQTVLYVNGKIESFKGGNPDLFDSDSLTTVSDIFIKDGITYKNTPYTGNFVSYHKNGDTHMDGYYVNGLKEYGWTEFYDNGQEKKYTAYKKGIKHSIYHEYYENGHDRKIGSYLDDNKHGDWFEFFENGNDKTNGRYLNGEKDGLWLEYEDSSKKPKRLYYEGGSRQLTTYPTFNHLIGAVIPIAIIVYFFYRFTG